MNWLAKINLQAIVRKIGVFKAAIILVTLVITCVFCGYRIGNYFHSHQTQALAYHKSRLEILYHQNSEQVKRIHTLEVELEVEKITNQRSLSSLRDTEAAHYQLKQELAFYEKVMAPEKLVDGVILDEFIITPTDISNFYNFQAVLVQKKKLKRHSKGDIDIIISGKQNNKKVNFSVKELSSLTKKELSFSFKFFQSLVGTIIIPESFVPEKVMIVITLPKRGYQKYIRTEESLLWEEVLDDSQKAIPVILD